MNMPDPFPDAESTIDRAEFLDRYRYKLLGIVYEATTIKFLLADGGASYEHKREQLMRECDKWLAAIYDEMTKPKIGGKK